MQSYSQIGQDLFVLEVLNNKQNGIFLDIGAGHPTYINNTYLLEKEFGWIGVSIDNDQKNETSWAQSNRSPVFMCRDALEIDYKVFLTALFIAKSLAHVDYLSIDLEPPIRSLEVLRKIPFKDFPFQVITFEHDSYRRDPGHDNTRTYTIRESRKILCFHGYRLVFSNSQEDWWIHPTVQCNYPDLDVNHIPY